MTQKKEETHKPCQPILIYLCGNESSEIKSSLLHYLSGTHFIQTNHQCSKQRQYETSMNNNEQYMCDCRAITNAHVFIFVIEENSICDLQCLRLLGIAIAFDIPVIGVRPIGYSLPRKLPTAYSSTEIIDRSQESDYAVNNQHLSSVTTLENVLKILFVQAVAFHTEIKQKCFAEIRKVMNGLHETKPVPSSNSLFRGSDDINTTTVVTKRRNESQSRVRITEWPVTFVSDRRNKTAVKKGNLLNQNSNSNNPNGNNANHNSKGKIIKLNDFSITSLALQFKKSKPPEKHYVRIQSSSSSKLKMSPVSNSTVNAAAAIRVNDIEIKDGGGGSTPTIRTKTPTQLDWKQEGKQVNQMRRQSSLPCIPTTYMVTSDSNTQSEPQIYHFPISPRLQVRQLSMRKSPSITSMALEDEGQLSLSRTCSPIDFRTDDEVLTNFNQGPVLQNAT